MKIEGLLMAIASFFVGVSAAAETIRGAEVLAVITEVAGEVLVKEPASSRVWPARTLHGIAEGASFELGTGARVRLLCRDGGVVELGASGVLTRELCARAERRAPGGFSRLVPDAGRIRAWAGSLTLEGETREDRGDYGLRPLLLSPSCPLEQAPRLGCARWLGVPAAIRWVAVEGAESYVLELSRASPLEVPAAELDCTAALAEYHVCRLPWPAIWKLEPGEKAFLRIEAQLPSLEKRGSQKTKIERLGEEEGQEVERALAEITAFGLEPATGALLEAALLAERGLVNESLVVLEAAAGERPSAVLRVALGDGLRRVDLLYPALGHYEQALAALDGGPDEPAVRAAAHLGLGWVHQLWGSPAPAREHAKQALELYRQLGLPESEAAQLLEKIDGRPAPEAARARAHELSQQAVTAMFAGDTGERVEAEVLEALRLFMQIEDLQGQAEAHMVLGTLYGRRETQTEAHVHFDASAGLWRRLGDRAGEWWALYGLAESSRFAGSNDLAIAALERAQTVVEALADPAVPLELGSLRLFLLGQGLPAESLPFLQGQLPVVRGFLIEQLAAMTAISRSTVLSLLGRYDEAVQVLEATRAAAGPQSTVLAKVLIALGEIRAARGESGAAMALFEQARARARDVAEQVSRSLKLEGLPSAPAGQFLLDEALALKSIAFLHLRAGRYDEAIESQRQALARERTLPNPALRAQLIAQMGMILLARGRQAQAAERFDKALALARATGAHDTEAMTLDFLAQLKNLAGRHEEALRLQQEAMAVVERMGHRGKEIQVLTDMAATSLLLHDLPAALGALQQADAVSQQIGDLSLRAMILNRLSMVYSESGDNPKALELAQQSLEVARRLGSPGEEAEALTALGWIYHYLDRDEAAVGHLEQARGLGQESGQPLALAAAELALGACHARLGLDEEAEASYRRALEATRDVGAESYEVMALGALAGLQRKKGDTTAAIATLETMAEKLDAHQGRLRVDKLAGGFSAFLPSATHRALADLYADRGETAKAFLYAERARARAFLDRLGRPWQALETGGYDERSRGLRALSQQIQRLESQLETTHRAGLEAWHSASAAQNREALATKREEFHQALLELELHRPETAALLSAGASTLEQVAASLDPETTLLAYFVLGNRVLAWVVDRESPCLLTLTIPREKLAQDVQMLTDGIASGDFDRGIASRLYEELITPLRTELRHRRLVVVPHDTLHELPFAALWNAREKRYFIEEHALAFAPSASVLRFLAAKRSPNEGRLLVLANPDGTLPGAEQEARTIAALYGAEAHLGAQASEARLRAAAGEIDLLHLAAHGSFDDQQPQFSRLELAAGDGQDGRLEVHEIFGGLDLRGVNLVVLSACLSGRGERTRGDDLLGLTRAFLYAGSPAVLSTLWSIDDDAARVLMEAFYSRLRAGENAAEALRRAQLATLARPEFHSPRYWAAFVLHGD